MGHKNKKVNSATSRMAQLVRVNSQSQTIACDLVQFLIRYRLENRYRNDCWDSYDEATVGEMPNFIFTLIAVLLRICKSSDSHPSTIDSLFLSHFETFFSY